MDDCISTDAFQQIVFQQMRPLLYSTPTIPLTSTQRQHLAKGAISSVAHLHSLGFVHRYTSLVIAVVGTARIDCAFLQQLTGTSRTQIICT